MAGDLTPGCTAALSAVLEALGKKAGPEDVRTAAQRRHDALEEACRRLVGAGGLPDRAGQPTQIQLHLTLDQLRDLDGAADAEAAWAARPGRPSGPHGPAGYAGGPRARPRAARAGRARASRGGCLARGAAPPGRTGGRRGQPGWLTGRAAQAYACDAAITPIVPGTVDQAALAALAAGPRPGPRRGPRSRRPGRAARLQDTLLRYAADVLSGPAGLAAFLRTGLPAPSSPPSACP